MKKSRAVVFAIGFCLFSACTPTSEMTVPSPTPFKNSTPLPTESTLPEVSPTPAALVVTPSPSPRPKPTPAPSSRVTIFSLPSTYRSDETRALSTVDTIVFHSLYNPESSTPFAIKAAKTILDQYEVSAHYVIDREGKVWQLVPDNYQSWHAGASSMPAPDGRTQVNAFSIGIELIGSETSGFTDAQYTSGAQLVADLMDRLPIRIIVGHGDIAEGRKTDPWGLDWRRLEQDIQTSTSKSFQILSTR